MLMVGDSGVRMCQVCWRQTDHELLYEKWGYPILRCRVCGLGSTDIPDGFDTSSLYGESYFQGGKLDGYADYLGSERVLQREFRRALEQLREHGPSEGRLLEVGCAYGFFLLEAQRYFQCVGVEISESAARYCRTRDLEVRCGVVNADLLQDLGPLDAVVMLDCIEHLPNPAETLRLLSKALSERGSLMISTGDWGSLHARAMGKRWRLMTPPQHLFYFSYRTLTMLLAKIGSRVVHSSRPWKVIPLGLAAYQLGNRVGIRLPFLESLSFLGMPLNLYDTIQIVARKEEG